MADSWWYQGSENQGLYNTPKGYDYSLAVKDAAPSPFGNAGDPEGGTDYPSQFVHGYGHNPNLDPALQYQGHGLDEPREIGGDDMGLNDQNYDEKQPPEDFDNGQDRTKYNPAFDRVKKEEKPFEGPMMTKKLILRLNTGNTHGWDQELIYMIPNGGWVKAVYHESIRLDLINKSKLNGEYDHERGAGIAPEDVTSYLESQRGWGLERDGINEDGSYREGDWPEILYQIQKPGSFSQSNPQYPKVGDWVHNGRLVLSVHDNLPLPKYDTLPDTISSKITGAEMEAMLRLNPRVKARDIVGRMPMYYLSDDGTRLQLYTSSTISMRTSRFRKDNALMCWRTRGGTDNTNDMIKAYLEEHQPQAIQAGSVRGIGLPPRAVVDALLESNKDNPAVTKRAGKKFTLGNKSAHPAVVSPRRLDRTRGDPGKEAVNPQLYPTVLSPRSILENRRRENRSQKPPSNTGPTIAGQEIETLGRNPATKRKRSMETAQPSGQDSLEEFGPGPHRRKTEHLPPAARPPSPEVLSPRSILEKSRGENRSQPPSTTGPTIAGEELGTLERNPTTKRKRSMEAAQPSERYSTEEFGPTPRRRKTEHLPPAARPPSPEVLSPRSILEKSRGENRSQPPGTTVPTISGEELGTLERNPTTKRKRSLETAQASGQDLPEELGPAPQRRKIERLPPAAPPPIIRQPQEHKTLEQQPPGAPVTRARLKARVKYTTPPPPQPPRRSNRRR